MKRPGANKKRKVVHRFRNRKTVEAKVTQKEIDVAMIDLVLKVLYNGGDRKTADLKGEILTPSGVKFTQEGVNRLWDVLTSTGLVSAVIGFTRSGRLEITNQGYQLMSQFGSYADFIKKREEEAAQRSAGNAISQFIIGEAGGDKEEESEEDGNIKKAASGDEEQQKEGGQNRKGVAAKKKEKE